MQDINTKRASCSCSRPKDLRRCLYQTARQWKDRTKLLSLPLFPCYAFLKGGLERRLEILTTPGVHALVSCAGVPAVIPTADIEAIRRAVESGSSVEPHPLLKCGEWVRVKGGVPLQGIQGILVRKKNSCRLVLSVEMLGKAAAVEIGAFLVEPIYQLPTASAAGVSSAKWMTVSTYQ